MIPEIKLNLIPGADYLGQRMSQGPIIEKSVPLQGPAKMCREKGRQINPSLFEKSPWIYMLNCVRENREILEDPGNADLELFVKQRITEPLKPGHKVKMGTHEGNVIYTIYKKIASDGLVSYALKPGRDDLPPLIVFRCTEPDISKEASLESIQNDLDPLIGQRGWNATKSQFDALMNDPNFRNPDQKVKVAGYSLGGLHANLFAGHHHKNVGHVISYSAPSMQSDLAKKFAKEINSSNRETPLIIQIFRTRGDPCHHAGEKQLGWGIDSKNAIVQLLETVVLDQQFFDFNHHSKLVFVGKYDSTFIETTCPKRLNIALDNLSKERGPCIELLRKVIGPSISEGLNVIENLAKKIFFTPKNLGLQIR